MAETEFSEEGKCPKCGALLVALNSDTDLYATKPGRLDCKHCKRIYEPIFGGYRIYASNEFAYGERTYPAAPSEPSATIQGLDDFQLESMPDDAAPFMSETVLYPLVGKSDARSILALWRKIKESKPSATVEWARKAYEFYEANVYDEIIPDGLNKNKLIDILEYLNRQFRRILAAAPPEVTNG